MTPLGRDYVDHDTLERLWHERQEADHRKARRRARNRRAAWACVGWATFFAAAAVLFILTAGFFGPAH